MSVGGWDMSYGDWDMSEGDWDIAVGDCPNRLTQCGKTQLESKGPGPHKSRESKRSSKHSLPFYS